MSAPAHVYSKDASPLEWRPWSGEEWQSFAEYFIPTLPSEGCVCPVDSPQWGPLEVQSLSSLISSVEGVHKVFPYLSLPCKVRVGDVLVDAILRGREFSGPDEQLSMAWQVKRGRPLGPEDEGEFNALIPLASEPKIPYAPGFELELKLPRPAAGISNATGTSGVSGAGGTSAEPGASGARCIRCIIHVQRTRCCRRVRSGSVLLG